MIVCSYELRLLRPTPDNIVFRLSIDDLLDDPDVKTALLERMDPYYRNSESGTGLAWFARAGVWCDRDGMHYFDALQLVALEESIITSKTEYPEGETFWKAVDALRKRGAAIPYFEGENGTHPDYLRLFESADSTGEKRRQVLRAMRAGKRT